MKKKIILEDKKNALDELIVEIRHKPSKKYKVDLQLYIVQYKDVLKRLIEKKLKKMTHIKFTFRIKVKLWKLELEEVIFSRPWFRSNVEIVYSKDDIIGAIDKASEQIMTSYDGYLKEGSGWSLSDVICSEVSFYKYVPLKGGYLSRHLPIPYRDMRSIISFPRLPNQKCFLYCVLAGLFPQKKRNYISYTRLEDKIDHSTLTYPVDLEQIKSFELLNKISINVYILIKNKPKNIRISTLVSQANNHLDLLLHDNHYSLIKSIPAFLRYANRRQLHQCKTCLKCFNKYDDLNDHSCNSFKTELTFNKKYQNIKFKNYVRLTRLPFVLYCDLETKTEKYNDITENNIKKKFRHRPIAYGLMRISTEKLYSHKRPILYVGDDCIERLFEDLKTQLDEITTICKTVNNPLVMTMSDNIDYKRAKNCYVCGDKFYGDKFRDHNHLRSGYNYRGAICISCNLNRTDLKLNIPLFFHNGGRFDLNFIIEKLEQLQKDEDHSIVAKTSENFMSFGLFNNKITIRDTFNHLNSSLSSLVNLLHNSNHTFPYTSDSFNHDSKLSLLTRKGVFPYSYVTSVEILTNTTSIPKKSCFYDNLREENISEKEYEHAKLVWNSFGCKTLMDYMKLYLWCDITLLVDVFENYRTFFMTTFILDPAYYISLPGLCYDCLLKHSKLAIDYVKDASQYSFLRRAIRGGVSMIPRRYAKANNPYIPGYDINTPTSYIIYLDCNSLYASVMTLNLPYKNLHFLSDVSLKNVNKILNEYNEEGSIGYFIECDLTYPSSIHDLTSDLPLAPNHKIISDDTLSEFGKMLKQKLGITSAPTKKLISDQLDKTNYITHIANLCFYIKMGMKLTKVHNILKFKQGKILKPYIDLCIKQRKLSTSKIDKQMWKLACNSVYGKTITNLENRVNVKLISDPNRLLNNIKNPRFKDAKIINSKLVQLSLQKPKINISIPYYIGVAILELSKLVMMQWHYDYFVKKYGYTNINLCMTDTDSLLYLVKTRDIYLDMKHNSGFDLSNFDDAHPCKNNINKGKLFYLKDEMGGKPIHSFVGLRSKSYGIDLGNDTKKIIGKGIPRYKLSKLSFQDLYHSLIKKEISKTSSNHIRSYNHKTFNIEQNKISLSPFDDKRYLNDDGITTRPFGHYSIKNDR